MKHLAKLTPESMPRLAAISVPCGYDWKEAGRLFEAAMTRGPLTGGARARQGHYLYFTGRAEAAVKEHDTAVQNDPLNLSLRSMLAWALMIAGRDADAASECRHTRSSKRTTIRVA